MSNQTQLSLYLVADGGIAPATAETEYDGINSILVAATSPESAMRVAQAYDYGQVAAENIAWGEKTIAVVTMRDAKTGLYA